MRYASFFRLIECTVEKNLHMQSIVNCLFIKGKEITTQAGEILKLRLLMLFRLIEKEFWNERWEFLQETLAVGERINNPRRSNKDSCQKITQTREIFCKRRDTQRVSGVRVMVKGVWDSQVCFGGTLEGFLFTENYGNSLWNCTSPYCLRVWELEAASENNGTEIQVRRNWEQKTAQHGKLL